MYLYTESTQSLEEKVDHDLSGGETYKIYECRESTCKEIYGFYKVVNGSRVYKFSKTGPIVNASVNDILNSVKKSVDCSEDNIGWIF